MKYHLLIDGDILVYSAAFANEKAYYKLLDKDMESIGDFSSKTNLNAYLKEHKELESYSVVKGKNFNPFDQVAITLHSILRSFDSTFDVADREIFLTGKGNYREELYPQYKKNRKSYQKPYWFEDTRQYLVNSLGAKVIDNQEADDELGIRQYNFKPKKKGIVPVIVSIDKDLNMIPGLHYNQMKESLFDVSEDEAMLCFYKQLLTGDTVDNIPGLPKVGPKTADKILEGCTTEKELHSVCMAAYKERKKTEDDLQLAGMLLWIRRERGEMWEPFRYGGEENRKVSVEV